VDLELGSLDETAALGALVAERLDPGDVVGLVGHLGAGKTTLVQAIARGLGVPASVPVTSPTFTLHQVYRGGRLPVHHFDLYRIETEADLVSLGLDDVLGREGVALVEWADRLGRAAPPDVLEIALEFAGETVRRATLSATGPRSAALVRALGASR
jgi:tRNA threonylcarbamoyladenosine biosynthesis protein TsaE